MVHDAEQPVPKGVGAPVLEVRSTAKRLQASILQDIRDREPPSQQVGQSPRHPSLEHVDVALEEGSECFAVALLEFPDELSSVVVLRHMNSFHPLLAHSSGLGTGIP